MIQYKSAKRNRNSQVLLVQFKEKVEMASLIELLDIQHVRRITLRPVQHWCHLQNRRFESRTVRKQFMELALQHI